MNKEFKQTTIDIEKDAKGKLTVIASKEVVDSDGDLVNVAGMNLSRFKSNPVMLFSHDRTAPPIGKWNNVRKTKDKDGTPILTMSPEFSQSPEHKMAKIISDLVDEGIMKAVSVSFRPSWDKIKYVEPKGKKKGFQVIEESELHEVSWVSVPANQVALVKALDDGKISKEDMDYLTKNTDTKEEVDKDLTIVELQSKVAELELLVKEQELEEETEDSIYSAIFDEFEMSAPNTVADDNQIDPEDVSLSDLLD